MAADQYDENIVYVTLSGYRNDSYQPHIFRSKDNWDDISVNLPEAPVNDVIIDPELDSTLYAATDFGVFYTRDLGLEWYVLGDNLPNVPIVDLDFHQPTRRIIAATYGRSMYSFSLDQLVSLNEMPGLESSFSIFPNPAREKIHITYPSKCCSVVYLITSIDGKIVRQEKVNLSMGFYTLDLNGIAPGCRSIY